VEFVERRARVIRLPSLLVSQASDVCLLGRLSRLPRIVLGDGRFRKIASCDFLFGIELFEIN